MPDAVSAVGGTATSTATTTVDRADQMGKDTFLKLLVAQMKYQDPANPASSTEFMAQTAAFTQVEKIEEIAKQNASLLALQRSSSAGALVGRTLTYTDTDGAAKTGVVSSVRLATDSSEAQAMVGGAAIALGRITEIATTAPAPETAPETTQATAPATTTETTSAPTSTSAS
ncbi:MAG: flagellar hook capping protein [Geodermatophilales bacterium]|nr:flagellar hook capping protein [Geodermatophilales bacterium]